MAERYVRPPVVAREPSPRWVPVWRWRLMILLITLALAGLVGWLMLTYVVQTEQDPSSPIGAPAPAAVGHPLVTR